MQQNRRTRHLGFFMAKFLFLLANMNSWAGETTMILFRPFDTNLKLKEVMGGYGQCLQQSKRIKREEAWRCAVQDKIYDPCFINPYNLSADAICIQSPWSDTKTKINLTMKGDVSQHRPLNMAETKPWALMLASGEKCEALAEAKQGQDGLPIQYQCNNHTVLLGPIQRCKSLWSILQKKPQGLLTVEITKAWF